MAIDFTTMQIGTRLLTRDNNEAMFVGEDPSWDRDDPTSRYMCIVYDSGGGAHEVSDSELRAYGQYGNFYENRDTGEDIISLAGPSYQIRIIVTRDKVVAAHSGEPMPFYGGSPLADKIVTIRGKPQYD